MALSDTFFSNTKVTTHSNHLLKWWSLSSLVHVWSVLALHLAFAADTTIYRKYAVILSSEVQAVTQSTLSVGYHAPIFELHGIIRLQARNASASDA